MKNIEVFKIEDGKVYISYQLDVIEDDDLNNGYRHIEVPYNPREIQLSIRGNTLVDQSVKDYSTVSSS